MSNKKILIISAWILTLLISMIWILTKHGEYDKIQY